MSTNLRMKTGCSLDTILHQLAAAKCNDSLADKAEPRRRSWLPTVIIYTAVKQKHLCKTRLHPANDHPSPLQRSEVEARTLKAAQSSKPRHVNAFPLGNRSPGILSILDKTIFGDQHI